MAVEALALKDIGKEVTKPDILKNVEVDKSVDIDKPLVSQRDKLTPMTDEYKEQLKAETGWSDEIIDAIGSQEEAEIYKKAGLVEAEINGKKCLIDKNIDMELKDKDGLTNKERIQNGNVPIYIDKNGEEKPMELHHIGQKSDAPLAELKWEVHRGKGNDAILHDKNKESEIDRKEFTKERIAHWQDRVDNV